MPKVNIDENSKHSAQETFQRVQNMLDTDGQIKTIDPSVTLSLDEANLSGTAKGRQFSAEFHVKESASGSSIHFVIDLPFLLSPLKGKIRSTIEEKLQKALA